ncbi:hypothetical protein ABIA38_006654 [Embleya sp. AB8]
MTLSPVPLTLTIEPRQARTRTGAGAGMGAGTGTQGHKEVAGEPTTLHCPVVHPTPAAD